MTAACRPIRVTVLGVADAEGVTSEPRDLDATAPDAPRLTRDGPGHISIRAVEGGAGAPVRRAAVAALPGADGRPRFEVVVDGWRFELEAEDAGRAAIRRRATRAMDAAESSGPHEIRAIIPGRIAAVRVAPGDAVEAGRTLLVVEAMKMQNELRAPRAGTVERVAVGEGDTIENGDLLVVLA